MCLLIFGYILAAGSEVHLQTCPAYIDTNVVNRYIIST